MFDSMLIVVDMQNDFYSGGALEVPGSTHIVRNVNRLIDNFAYVVATQDIHPDNHCSFASNHDQKPFTEKNGQMLWPDHCVEDSWGADFIPGLHYHKFHAIFRKGFNPDVESYSGVLDANGEANPLGMFLTPFANAGSEFKIVVCGLATDYCVISTAQDCAKIGFNTYVVTDASASVDPDFQIKGPLVRAITTDEILKVTRLH